MATEVDLTYLGRLFINQYVFKLDVRLVESLRHIEA